MVERQAVVSVVERVIQADPTKVWSLLADPGRVDEWAGVILVGYMGTELPRVGQSVFVRRPMWRSKAKRVEIEAWDAGAGIRCLVHARTDPIGFELTIHPEVESESISTTVRLMQTLHVPGYLRMAARGWGDRQLSRKLDRIERAVTS